MVEETGPGTAPARDSAPQALLLRELEERTGELQRLAREVKAAYNTMAIAPNRSERARLRKEWLDLAGQWSVLQVQFDASMRAYEAAFGTIRARARSRNWPASQESIAATAASPPRSAAGH